MPNFDEKTGIRYGVISESDSGEDHLQEIIGDLKYENKAELLKMGFSEKEIDGSLDNADGVD